MTVNQVRQQVSTHEKDMTAQMTSGRGRPPPFFMCTARGITAANDD